MRKFKKFRESYYFSQENRQTFILLLPEECQFNCHIFKHSFYLFSKRNSLVKCLKGIERKCIRKKEQSDTIVTQAKACLTIAETHFHI